MGTYLISLKSLKCATSSSRYEFGRYQRGKDIADLNGMKSLTAYVESGILFLNGLVSGRYQDYYTVEVQVDGLGDSDCTCSCPDSAGVHFCKHGIALLLSYYYDPSKFRIIPTARELINGMSAVEMKCLIMQAYEKVPMFRELAVKSFGLSRNRTDDLTSDTDNDDTDNDDDCLDDDE